MPRIYLTSLTFLFLSLCAQAQFWKTSEVRRISGTVNTGAEESIPVFSADMKSLYFVRSMDVTNLGGINDQDIWYSTLDVNGAYGECVRVKELSNKFNNSIVGLNKAGTKMYVLNAYEGKKDMEKGISVSTGSADLWSTPEKVEIPGLDIEGEYYGFHVASNENVIILSYAGAGTKGQEDLYYSTRNGNSWTSLTHMGPAINSAGFEIAPFLSKTMDTLFFSSNGFGGQGDADIFFSVKQGSWSSWSAPVNLGPKINSPKFDAYFQHNDKQAYWSSNRDGELSDIYMLDILAPPPITVACKTMDATVYKGKDGSIQLSVEGGMAPYTYNWSNGEGQKDLRGLGKGEYTVSVSDASGQSASAVCKVGEAAEVVAEFKNLEFMHNFAYNKDKLTTSDTRLKEYLSTIEQQIKNGRSAITVQIISSASQVPTKTFGTNEKLAQSRAENMRKQLMDYFGKTSWKDCVKVEIAESKVQGPAYSDDAADKVRYEAFQYIQLKTK